MKLSPFGLCVRKLRLEAGASLKAMAEALGVSSAYLSAVELNEKPLTQKVIDGTVRFFAESYPLETSAEDLRAIADAGAATLTAIPVEDLAGGDRGLVAAFARRLSEGQGVPQDVMDWIQNREVIDGRRAKKTKK